MTLNPWVILGGVLVIIGTHTAMFKYGINVEANRNKAEQLDLTNKAISQAKTQSVIDDKSSQVAVEAIDQIRVEYRTIKEKVFINVEKNPVYAECELDADGLRHFNAGTDPATSNTGGVHE